MSNYQKKAVLVSAFRFQLNRDWPSWLTNAVVHGEVYYQGGSDPYATVKTDAGDLKAFVGDWIICGPKHKLSVEKDEAFRLNYEQLPEARQ